MVGTVDRHDNPWRVRQVPARIVLVNDDETFLIAATSALKEVWRDVAAFSDPMAALGVLIDARTAGLLITRVEFAPGKPNGVALARMARAKRPDIKVLFTALAKYAEHAVGLGAFLPMPVDLADLTETTARLLGASDQPA